MKFLPVICTTKLYDSIKDLLIFNVKYLDQDILIKLDEEVEIIASFDDYPIQINVYTKLSYNGVTKTFFESNIISECKQTFFVDKIVTETPATLCGSLESDCAGTLTIDETNSDPVGKELSEKYIDYLTNQPLVECPIINIESDTVLAYIFTLDEECCDTEVLVTHQVILNPNRHECINDLRFTNNIFIECQSPVRPPIIRILGCEAIPDIICIEGIRKYIVHIAFILRIENNNNTPINTSAFNIKWKYSFYYTC